MSEGASSAPATAETTGHHEPAGFPPFKTETYPSQLFWLTISFVLLFIVVWRIALPRIGGALTARKGQIDGDLGAAEMHRREAADASAAYDAALAAAKARAHGLADENRRRLNAEVDAAKAKAEAEAQAGMQAAEARIAQTRNAARAHVAQAAQDAAAAIVQQLTGDNVSADEARAAVASVSGS